MEKRIWLLAVVLTAALPACRYQNVNAVGHFGPAPFDNLQCFDAGNAEGFSFEVPACDCEAGIRLSLVINRTERGTRSVRYVQQVGWADGDPASDILMAGEFSTRLDELTIGGRRLPSYVSSNADDRKAWDRYQDVFQMTWQNYAPITSKMIKVCDEDRLYRTASRLAQRTETAAKQSRKKTIFRKTTLICQ